MNKYVTAFQRGPGLPIMTAVVEEESLREAHQYVDKTLPLGGVILAVVEITPQ